MVETANSPGLSQDRLSSEDKRRSEGAFTPKAKLNFGIQELASPQAPNPTSNANPFAVLGEGNPGAEAVKKIHEDLKEGWTFQGRKKHTLKITSPRQVLPQSPAHSSSLEVTPGGRRKRAHSDVHYSSFASLGIPVPPGQEHARTRIWPVLTRAKNDQKKTLVYSRNNTPPSLPLNIRITGSSEAEWTQDSALADLAQRIETELEEKVLRYNLNLKDRLTLEWSWQEDLNRGGMECTILAQISTGTSAISVQNKRHLHWKTPESMPSMNNDVEFAGPAHNLLLKSGPESTDRQAHKNMSANLQASPQAVRKKRYIKLDLTQLEPPRANSVPRTPEDRNAQGAGPEDTNHDPHTVMGSIGPPAAQNRLAYV
ncbi:unnamed protein product [Sphagnum balticum]|jgi:hypothetical protein